MAQHLDDSLAAPRAVGTLIGVLGLLGLALAAIGLYAVVAFTVARRARDIGIRIALGARRHQAVAAIARHVAGVVAAGTAVGLTVTLLAIFSLRAATVSTPGIVVYRPAPEPLALFAVAAFVAVVALAATIIPARRAATMDPLTALRRD
jgi:ABC-type antimicrobial peptide transport system permease subunit